MIGPHDALEVAEERLVEAQRAAEAAEGVVRRLRDHGARDGPAAPFAHLAVRSCYSMRDGAIRPRELTAAAAAAGMTHVAVTDRDGLYGAVRFAQAAEADGVVPVFGTDLALEPDLDRPGWAISRAGRRRAPAASRPASDPRGRRPGRGPAWLEDDAPRVVFLARTQQGYGDLCRAITSAHLGPAGDGSNRSSPHLTWEGAHTAARHEGAYVLLGPDAPLGRLLADGRVEDADAELRRWLDLFGRDGVLVGIRDWLERDPSGAAVDAKRNRHALALAERHGVTPVAVNDVRYLTRDDVVLADVLACIREQVPLGRHHLGRRSAEGWFKTAADLAPLFAERTELLSNAQQVAESCEVDLGLGQLHVPRLTGLSDEVAAGELHRRCWSGVAERFPRVTPRIRGRLEDELAMVDRLGLHDYFLTAAEVVQGIRELGILAACRGSAAGSLVCYALRISDVDPVAHDLAFERFMNPYRDELPDIDIDVESARREDVYRMVLARYGEERTACVAMIETFQARMAIREVGKVLGLPPDEIGVVAKSFHHARARDVRRMLASAPELARANLDAGQLELLFDIVERIDGFPRHVALHPCGILLADTHLQDRTPLEPSGGGRDWPMSQFDKDDVAAMGLLKLDVLAVRLLSSMAHTVDLLRETRDLDLDLSGIADDDPATYELLRSTRSIGVFQIESPGQRELLGRLQPDRFGDLVVEISLFRPGPVKADMIEPFIAARHGRRRRGAERARTARRDGRRRGAERARTAQEDQEVEATYLHPSLKPALAETHGVIVYHEQVMKVVAALTGCDLSYADLVRRQLADGRKARSLEAWAVSRAVQRGFTRAAAERIWHQVIQFASFGFCKAHAAAFAIPTYRSAWLKAHYLPEFIAGLLTHDPGMYPKRLMLDEARSFAVAALPPDVNRSQAAYTVEVVDQGLALHLLGVRDGRLPPGWRRGDDRSVPPTQRLVPPGGWDAGDAGNGYRYAIRVGLDDVRGITDDEVASLVAGRPFTSLEDVRRRGALSRPTAGHLARAGGFDQLAGVGRLVRGRTATGRSDGPDREPYRLSRRDVLLAVEELWASARSKRAAPASEQTQLDVGTDHVPMLPPQTDADVVRDELEVLHLDVSRHVLDFYAPLLDELGVIESNQLTDQAELARVRVAGVKVAVQSPPVKSGQRVLFLSLDDRTSTSQVTYFERVLDDCAWTILHAWLVMSEGRVRKRGAKGVTVTGERVWDVSRLWRAWQEGWLPDALEERGTPAAHQRHGRAHRPAGLHASEFGRGSR